MYLLLAFKFAYSHTKEKFKKSFFLPVLGSAKPIFFSASPYLSNCSESMQRMMESVPISTERETYLMQ